MLPDGQGQGSLAGQGPLRPAQENRKQGDLGVIGGDLSDPAMELSELPGFAACPFRKDDDALPCVEKERSS